MKQGGFSRNWFALIAVVLVAALLAGCSSLGGNASYTYTRTGNDCTVRIESGRNVEGPASAQITDCNVDIGAGALSQGKQSFSLDQALQIGAALHQAKMPTVELPPKKAEGDAP